MKPSLFSYHIELLDAFKQANLDTSPLSAEDEHALFHRIRAGDPDAKKEMIHHNVLLVLKIINQFPVDPTWKEDLVQEGICGLMDAIEKFDIDRGLRFSTFATWRIRRMVIDATYAIRYSIGMPINYLKEYHRVHRWLEDVEKETGKKPSVDELILHFHIPKERAERWYSQIYDQYSLDELTGQTHQEDDFDRMHYFAQADQYAYHENFTKQLEREEFKTWLHEQLAQFKPSEKELILYRYNDQIDPSLRTLDQMSKHFQLPKRRIQAIEGRILRLLKPNWRKKMQFDR